MNKIIESTEIIWPASISEVPKEVFVREDVFEKEIERIFMGAQWHPVAMEAEIPNIGDFKTFDLGRSPLLITRGKDNTIRAFFNACTHRGTQLETEVRGNRSAFKCPYHSWMFNLQGDLAGCPGIDEFKPGFEKSDYRLNGLRVEIFCGIVFVTASEEAPDLLDWLGQRPAETIKDALGGGRPLEVLGYQKTLYSSNWKAYADNDGYHPPLLHAAFRLLGWQGGAGEQYATENGHGGVESQLKRATDNGFLNDFSLIEFKGESPLTGSRVVQLFPFTVIVKHLDVISIRFAIPRSVDETEVHYVYFGEQDDTPELRLHRVRQASNLLGPCGMISMEDAAVFQRIHQGSYTPGVAEFQKGVRSTSEIWFDYKQNDEAANIPKWEYYRKIMGFRRETM